MVKPHEPGLGELLRHLTTLVDQGSEKQYLEDGFLYRARFTPILRVLDAVPRPFSEIQERLHVSQSAASQTIRLMEDDGLIKRYASTDKRAQNVQLTTKGVLLKAKLESHWIQRMNTFSDLEAELEAPLRDVLFRAIQALEEKPMSERIAKRKAG